GPAPAAARERLLAAQVGDDIGLRCLDGGRQPREYRRGGRRHEREREHAPVDPEVQSERERQGRAGGPRDRAAPPTPPQPARGTPTAAPSAAMTNAAVRSWRTSRPRLAPTARRMPISRCRPEARASSMLATFAHAISSTSPTTTISPAAIGSIVESAAG